MPIGILAVLVFFAAAALDVAEAFYVRSIGQQNPHRAAVFSVAMYAIGCVGFFAVLDVSYWLMIPECAGLYLGSVLAVRFQRRPHSVLG